MNHQRQCPLDATASPADEYDDQDDLNCVPGHYDYLAEQEQRFVRQAIKEDRRPRRMRAHY